jgi:hypothetical protein
VRHLLLSALVVAAPAGVASSAAAAPAAKPNIYVIASKSFCLASGVSDQYTGNGKIIFYVTLRNSGRVAGKVNIIPVRHYDDGGVNESGMDMLIDVQVPARSTRRFRSPFYSYKAHEHELAGCGVKIDGRGEVTIAAAHL